MSFDVVVVGSGPAGLALAAELAAGGLRVAAVDPAPERGWPNTYGVWVEALPEALRGCLGARWPVARVRLDAGRTHAVPREYGRIDNAALKQALLRRGPGLTRIADRVRAAEHHRAGSQLTLASGARLEARVVVDATGAGALLERPPAVAGAAQVAYGQVLAVERLPLPPHELLLMDFSPLPVSAVEDGAPISFLYAMPLGPERLFVEETVLVGRPPPRLEVLQDRLQRRLLGLDLLRAEVLEEERCVIPMGGPPPRSQRVVAFGAAAGMVNPATGYQLALSLGAAPRVAEALAAGLRAEVGPEGAASAAWEALWPAPRRRLWAAYRFGMEVLLGLDGEDVRGFFDAFFRLPAARWAPYLDGQAVGPAAAQTMMGVFLRVNPRLRWHLVSSGLGPSGQALLRELGA